VLVVAVLALAVVAGAAALLLAQSEGGTRLLLDQVARLLPVRFEQVNGALADRVYVDRLVYELEGRELIVDGLDVELRLIPLLFDDLLEITSVHADSVELTPRDGPPPDTPPWRLELPTLPVDVRLVALSVDRLTVSGFPVGAARGSATLGSDGLEVHELAVDGERLEGRVLGAVAPGSNPEVDAKVEWAVPQAGWKGHGELAGPADEVAVSHEATGQYHVTAEGTVDLAIPAEPKFDLHVKSAAIAFGEIALQDLQGRISGDLEAFELAATATTSSPYGAPFPVSARASGALMGPTTYEIEAHPLEGEAIASGAFDWRDGVNLTATGRATDLRIDSLQQRVKGKISGAFEANYVDGVFDVTLQELSGIVDERPVEGHGHIHGGGAVWQADNVELRLGDNRANLDGSWNDGVLSVVGAVDAPAVEQLALGMTGGLTATVDVAGKWPDLDGSVQVTSAELAFGELRSHELATSMTLKQGDITGDLKLTRLATGAISFDSIHLRLSGPLEMPDWRLRWEGGDMRGRARYADELGLDIAAIEFEAVDHRFSSDTAFTISRDAAGTLVVTPVCIVGADARACVKGLRYEGSRIVTSGVLERLPFALLAAELPVALAHTGVIEGTWDVNGAGSEWNGSFDLAARGLQAEVAPGEEQERIALPDVVVAGTLAGNRADATLRAAGPQVSIEGNAGLTPIAADGALNAIFVMQADDLAWLEAFDQRIAEVGGTANGRAIVTGTPARPVVEGFVDLGDGVIAIEGPGLRLERITARARVGPEGDFDINGQAVQSRKGKDGSVELRGHGTGLFGGELAFVISVDGQRVRVTDPEWEVDVSPDLDLTRAGGKTALTGLLELPRADVRLKTLPSSVPRASPDVVVIGREAPRVAVGEDPVGLDVKVRLGDDVKLSALGLEAELEGEVNVQRDARGQPRVRGTLDVTGGRLVTQGQTLEIEGGTVAYNGPVGNPYIDVRAVREVDDGSQSVRVGLRIQGNVNRLTSTVYSEPAMAENRALGYLILGRDIEAEQTDEDSNQLLTAAINLGLSQSKSLTSKLRQISGLDELSAVAESEDSFAIAAGKRISDQLFLRYTYNTLTAASAVLISLHLTDRWSLEAQSGEYSAMDLLYRYR
jgi:autotransporter translocation and assembly factor TamB